MERIRKALERAGQDRQLGGIDSRLSPPPQAGADLSTGVRYTMTRMVEVPEQLLRDNRIITALPQHKHRDSYRMLRTRVLQTMRNNGWTSIA
ncbi:MAG: exopolysaccharide biosynthesis protein, partial [Gammaproteobacteria bacterium]|nr:exopolysaccharide biosynthesis protein [Gammaproteobacteria bacterium]